MEKEARRRRRSRVCRCCWFLSQGIKPRKHRFFQVALDGVGSRDPQLKSVCGVEGSGAGGGGYRAHLYRKGLVGKKTETEAGGGDAGGKREVWERKGERRGGEGGVVGERKEGEEGGEEGGGRERKGERWGEAR